MRYNPIFKYKEGYIVENKCVQNPDKNMVLKKLSILDTEDLEILRTLAEYIILNRPNIERLGRLMGFSSSKEPDYKKRMARLTKEGLVNTFTIGQGNEGLLNTEGRPQLYKLSVRTYKEVCRMFGVSVRGKYVTLIGTYKDTIATMALNQALIGALYPDYKWEMNMKMSRKIQNSSKGVIKRIPVMEIVSSKKKYCAMFVTVRKYNGWEIKLRQTVDKSRKCMINESKIKGSTPLMIVVAEDIAHINEIMTAIIEFVPLELEVLFTVDMESGDRPLFKNLQAWERRDENQYSINGLEL